MPEKPHPLAVALADLLDSKDAKAPRFVLLLGGGGGRNIPPLLGAHRRLDVLEEDAARAQTLRDRFGAESFLRIAHGPYEKPNVFQQRYDAALSTHALLHGSPHAIRVTLRTLGMILSPDADLLLTLGSAHDPRYGAGRRIDAQTWAPEEGPETGVPHVYYNHEELQTLLASFSVVSLREVRVREVVGNWAHVFDHTPDIVHWFAHVKNVTPSSSQEDRASG